MGRVILVNLIASAVVVASAQVRANPDETFAASARAGGMAGAMAAAAASYDACHHNPAALSRLQGPEAGLGVLVYRPFLRINGADAAANRTRALESVGFATPVPLGRGLGDILFLGIEAKVPGLSLYSIRSVPVTEPHFPFLQDRNRRLVLNVALAVRLHRILAIGAGFSLLPDVAGDVRVDFAGGGDRSYTFVDVTAHLSPNVGILVQPHRSWSFALVWRGANRTRLSIPTSVDVSKIPPIRLDVRSPEYWTPHQITLGVAWQVAPVLLDLDVTYAFYRDFEQASPTVVLYDSQGSVSKTNAVADPGFHDTIAVRAGVEWRIAEGPFLLRAGFAFQQSPVPAQHRESNLLDAHRFTGAIGAGLDVAAAGGPPLMLDVHLAWTGLAGNHDEKLVVAPSNPGYPSIRSGGGVFSAALDCKVRF